MSIFDDESAIMGAAGESTNTYNLNQILGYEEQIVETTIPTLRDTIHAHYTWCVRGSLPPPEVTIAIADSVISTISAMVRLGLSAGLPMDRLWREHIKSCEASNDHEYSPPAYGQVLFNL